MYRTNLYTTTLDTNAVTPTPHNQELMIGVISRRYSEKKLREGGTPMFIRTKMVQGAANEGNPQMGTVDMRSLRVPDPI